MLVTVPVNAWYGDNQTTLDFPDDWLVRVCPMHGAPALDAAAIRAGFDRPIGTPPLRELARGRARVAVVVEDITRPLPLAEVLGVLLAELAEAGVKEERTFIVVGGGTHRAMLREELLKKLGPEIVARYRVVDHNPYEDLVTVGTTSRGVVVRINAEVAAADLVVGVGGLYPHGAAGFSGGGKIILPGVAGIDTIEQNHRIPGRGYGFVESENRLDIEDAARLAGLAFIANMIVNGQRRVAGIRTGDPVAAHRAAVRDAQVAYATEVPAASRIVVANAYPMDTELFQAAKALGAALQVPGAEIVVLHAGCNNGFGYHALCQPGGRLHAKEKREVEAQLAGKQLLIVSPNISRHDILRKFPQSTLHATDWAGALSILRGLASGHPTVTVLPTAPIQVCRSGQASD